jgi:carbon storage regulator
MLVLSRARGQRIVLDGNIVVTVVSLHGNRVRLGIEAPAEVDISRQEVCVRANLEHPNLRSRELA